MSRQRKTAAVLRLLRGEDLERVSRSLSVTAATLSGWRESFLAAGEAVLVTKTVSGEELESERLKAKLGAALSSEPSHRGACADPRAAPHLRFNRY
jgi:transposase